MEDDDAAQCLLEIAFRELGPEFYLYRVTNGAEALKFLTHVAPFTNAPKPDLILSNLNMPGMSGIELLVKIQADESLKRIPVVVLSSSRLTSDRAECLAMGAKQFINKPDSYQDFIRALQTACTYIDGVIAAGSL